MALGVGRGRSGLDAGRRSGHAARRVLIVGNLSVAGFLQHANDPYAEKELALLFLAVAIMFFWWAPAGSASTGS